MFDLQAEIAAANKRAGLAQQKGFAKRAVVRQTADQVIDMLCDRAQEALTAFYKGDTAGLREAMRNLQGAVAVAGKRVR